MDGLFVKVIGRAASNSLSGVQLVRRRAAPGGAIQAHAQQRQLLPRHAAAQDGRRQHAAVSQAVRIVITPMHQHSWQVGPSCSAGSHALLPLPVAPT